MVQSINWLVPALLLLAAAGFVSLGRWQLDRAEVNRAIESGYAEAAGLPPLDGPVGAAEAEQLRYRRIRLEGRYRPERQVLLDNMTSNGQVGYEVLTPFDVGSSRLVLVNRGFVPASPDRRELPDVALDSEPATVTGRIDRLPRAALSLGRASPEGSAQLTVLSFPDYAAVETALGRAVYPFQVLLDPESPQGFTREWAPATDRDERNVAYAVQWFGLAALAAVLAVGSAIRSHRRARGAAT